MTVAWIALFTVCFLLLASPIVWVACINVVGLKRLSQRISYLEDDTDGLRNKTRSLQTQVSKKNRAGSEQSQDEEIDREISAHIKSQQEFPPDNPVSRGGLRDAPRN